MQSKIISVYFDYRNRSTYKKLSDIWLYSLKKNTPSADVELIKISAPDTRNSIKKSFSSNTCKLDVWVDCIDRYDCPILFMDCDMLVLDNVLEPFNKDFDIAYTLREHKLPFNGGVLYYKPTTAAKKFMHRYRDVNNKMFKNPGFHKAYRRKYAGMNQAAFGYMLEEESKKVNIAKLPDIWNLCEKWNNMPVDTKAVHVKSALRRACLGNQPDRFTKQAFAIWKKYEKEFINYS